MGAARTAGSALLLGVVVITRHPYRAVGAVLAVLLPAMLLAGLIGQHGDGPLGGLPDWLGTAAYTTFMTAAGVLVALSLFLSVANLRYRRSVR